MPDGVVDLDRAARPVDEAEPQVVTAICDAQLVRRAVVHCDSVGHRRSQVVIERRAGHGVNDGAPNSAKSWCGRGALVRSLDR